MSRYRIPKARTRTETRASNSRFIATIAPASTMKEAQAFLREIRAEMPDATHHVYAFRIGYGASVTEAMSDDGEPSGTSGPPALAVVRGSDVGDVALVITRYFGGTKLGTGGLVAAYTQAAQAAFGALETVEKISRTRVCVSAPYAAIEPVKRLLAQYECIVEKEDYGALAMFEIQVPDDHREALEQSIRDVTGGKASIDKA